MPGLPHRHTRLAAAAFAAVTLAAGSAEANHDTILDLVVSPGITFSFSLGAPRFVFGVGLECSVLSPWRDGVGSMGGVAQAQVLTDGTFRFALSAQAGTAVGLELGLAARTGNATRAFSWAVHAAPYLSVGYAYVSYDFNLTLGEPLNVRRFEHLLHVGGKVPYGRYYPLDPLTGARQQPSFEHYQLSLGGGRPLLRGGLACLAPLQRANGAPLDEGTTPAATWARDARFEHASIATFARLSLELMALGAPLDLVRRAHRAALDEIAHAELCLALAGAEPGGCTLSLGSLPEAVLPLRAPDLATLAVESLREGCLGEGVAAAYALEASRVAQGTARAALERIAEDEAGHAELAWAVLDWCQREGGKPVRDALAASLRTLPDLSAPSDQGPGPYGLVDGHRAWSLAKQVTRRVLRRASLPRRSDTAPAAQPTAA